MGTRLIIFLAVIPFLSGCGVIYPAIRSESKLSHVELGQSRGEVISNIGSPSVVRGSKKEANGSVYQIDEYSLYKSNVWWIDALSGIPSLTLTWWDPLGRPSPYWLHYVDGKLDHWGKERDWQPDVTADVTVRQR